MAAATSVALHQNGNQQFGGVFSNVKTVVAVLDTVSIASGAGTTDTVAIPTVLMGDFVLAISAATSLAGLVRTAYVSAAGVVTIATVNNTGVAVDLPSTVIKIVVASPTF
jgi:hypothetical protein